MKLSKVLVLGTMLSVTSAWAQYFQNGGPAVDINFEMQRPSKYAFCDKYINSSAKVYRACELGRYEAESMAERYAGGNGRIEGYLRGFSYALRKWAQATENDASSMSVGAQAVAGMGSYMQSGLDAGRRQGESDGRPRGEQDARKRFHDVLDRNIAPDATLKIPAVSYAGEDNAYQKYVGAVPSTQDIMRKEISEDVRMIPAYDRSNATYIGERQPYNVWDFWFDNGTYLFEKAKWYDGALALNVWKDRRFDAYATYENLNVDAPVDPTTNQPMNLKAVFEDAFLGCYKHYVNYFFSSVFHKSLDEGYVQGEMVGKQVGKRVAYYKGLVAAFNTSFKESSKQTYTQAFSGSYKTSFEKEFAAYLNNPVLSLSFVGLIGEDNDGIIQPGENFGVKFKITNVGGVGSELNATVAGDIVDPVAYKSNIGKLQSKVFETSVIGQVDPRLLPRETAQIILKVNNLSAQFGQVVNKLVEFSSQEVKLNVTQGNGSIQMTAYNTATVRTMAEVSATLQLNGALVTTEQAGFFNSGESKVIALPFKNLDPLKLIEGQIDAVITLKMNEKVLDMKKITLKSSDSELDLVKYFDQLANRKAFVPASTSNEERLTDVKNKLTQLNTNETFEVKEGENLYKRDPGATIPGKLVNFKTGGMQSEEALNHYDSLARMLAPAGKNLPSFLSAKRGSFKTLLEKLTRNGRIQIK